MYKLLLVDDNEFERNGISYLLQKYQIPVSISEVSNGLDALALLKSEHFDVLISDIKMPIMDGIELIKRVREFDTLIDVVIISGYDDFEFAKKLLNSNIVNYILKPLNTLEFIETITNLPCLKKESTTAYSKIINQVLTIIESEFSQNLSLEDLASRVFLSPSYLSNLFKKEVGENMIPYLNQYRLERARDLLTHSNMKVTDIAVFVGIPNTSYFNRMFKAAYHMSPSTYRKNQVS